MSQFDDLIHSAEELPMRERISLGYESAGKLYEAFKKVTDSKGASNLLYGMIYVNLREVGKSISSKEYEFASKAIGSSLDYDRFVSKCRECSDFRLLEEALRKMNNDEYSAFVNFTILLYSADGYVDSKEREFLRSLFG